MKKIKSQKGQAIVLIALAMVGLVAFTALTIDGGRVLSDRRNAQNAADTSALAAALGKLQGKTKTDYENLAYARALSNGYERNGTNSKVVVKLCSEVSGADACQGIPAGHESEYIRVRITSIVNTTFARVIGRQQLTNVVEAITRASGSSTPGTGGGSGYGITALKKDGTGLDFSGSGDYYFDGSIATNAGLDLSGSGSVHITKDFIVAGPLDDSSSKNWLIDGDVWVNGFSKSGSGGWTVGGSFFSNQNFSMTGSSDLTANTLEVVGSYSKSNGNAVTPWTPTKVAAQTPPVLTDPFASILNPPAKPGGCITGSYKGSANNIINPGCYNSIAHTGSGDLTLNPGIYYIIGDFSFGGSGDLTANGVMIYLEGGSFSANGSGMLTVSPITTGAYKGLSIYMDRSNSNPVSITGSGGSSFTGTVYAPASSYSATGSGGNFVVDSQIICAESDITGSGSLSLSYDPDNNYNPGDPSDPEIQIIQ